MCSARKISFINRSLTVMLFSLFRMVHALNRNIVCTYFPHGFNGMCRAHPNYVCSRRIEEKINYFSPLIIQLNLKHWYSDVSLIFVYIDNFLISYFLMQMYTLTSCELCYTFIYISTKYIIELLLSYEKSNQIDMAKTNEMCHDMIVPKRILCTVLPST